ncbi:MAG: M48 family metalloprotease [Pseudomonadota bacterium]
MMLRILLPLILVLGTLSGCAINPVTGKSELSLVSESQEIALGQKNYLPMRQMQGGDYVVDKALTKYIDEVGQRLAKVSDRKLPYQFVVLNNSVPNAWALPGGKIAFNRGLLVELNNEAELAAVIGHEIVHAAARHGAKGMERGMLLQGAVLATAIATSNSDYAALATGGAQVSAQLVNTKYGRDAELESDLYGMEYMKRAGYDPSAAIKLQETFVRLSEGRNQSWIQGLFASHPPSQERVDTNRETAQRLGAGGELGAARFKKMTAHALKTKAAYSAYDKGRKALKDGDAKTALRLAEKAISIEPKESHFYALKGDVLLEKNNYKDALGLYNKALQLNSNFFRYYVQRGVVKQKLGNDPGAKKDFEASAKLLPTDTAMNGLGKLALAANDRQSAIKYFEAAASSNSADGKQAQSNLVRLDLSVRPERYLKLRTGLNKRGYVVAEVTNPTSVAIRDVRVTFQYLDSRGGVRDFTAPIPGILKPGARVQVPTRLGPVSNTSALRNVKARISEAKIAN